MLILNTDRKGTQGYSLVYFTTSNATSVLDDGYIGALKGSTITVNESAVDTYGAGVAAYLTRRTANNGITTQTGIGSINWIFRIPAGKQSVFASVTPKGNMPAYEVFGSGAGRFVERTKINSAGTLGETQSATYNSWVDLNRGSVYTP